MRPKLSPVLLPFAFDFEHLTVFDFECCGSLVAAVRVTDVTRTVHVLHSLCMPWEVPIGSVFSEPAQVCNIPIYFSDPMDPRNVEAQRCQNHLKHSKSPQRSWQHDAPCVLCYEHHCPGLKNVAAEASCFYAAWHRWKPLERGSRSDEFARVVTARRAQCLDPFGNLHRINH